jgi:hypothetical protein
MMAEINTRSAYTEVVRHGTIVFKEQEAIAALLVGQSGAGPLLGRPDIAEGQEGWVNSTKYTLIVSDGEVIIGVQTIWSKTEKD